MIRFQAGRPEDGRFSAEFPSSPTREQEAVTSSGIDLEATVYQRLFLVGTRIYTILGVAREGRPASYDRLLATFALL